MIPIINKTGYYFPVVEQLCEFAPEIAFRRVEVTLADNTFFVTLRGKYCANGANVYTISMWAYQHYFAQWSCANYAVWGSVRQYDNARLQTFVKDAFSSGEKKPCVANECAVITGEQAKAWALYYAALDERDECGSVCRAGKFLHAQFNGRYE